MRHAVLGAGGVGGLVGGALARAGHPVTLLVRPSRRHHYPKRLTVESNILGNFEAPVRVADRLDEPFDVVWITIKATVLETLSGARQPQSNSARGGLSRTSRKKGRWEHNATYAPQSYRESQQVCSRIRRPRTCSGWDRRG